MYFLCGWVGGQRDAEASPSILTAMGAAAANAAATPASFSETGPAHAILARGPEVCHAVGRGLLAVVIGRPRWRGTQGYAPPGEVAAEILEAYSQHGGEFLERLAGSFLVAVIDQRRPQLLLATDRFGVTPGYYSAQRDTVVFSSRLKPVLAHPGVDRAVSQQSIYDYMFFHCVPSPQTIYRDVRKLQPAERLDWQPAQPAARHYWSPRFRTERLTPGERGHAAQTLQQGLEAAVARELEGKPAGAFLSGGLDSSSVAGMLSRRQQTADTFTIGFDAPDYDESAYARIAAKHFGTRHHEYFMVPDDVVKALPGIAAHYDEPFGNSSALPTYYCARVAREHGVALMLAGDGGDELFAGNARYVAHDVFERYFKLPRPLRLGVEGIYRVLPPLRTMPVTGKGYRYLQQANMGLPDRLQSYNFLNRFPLEQVFAREWLAGVDADLPWQAWRSRYQEPANAEVLQRMLYLDWKFTLADNDLMKVSGMCELAGVEVAYPMLDDTLLNLAVDLDPATLLVDGKLRGFYKQAMSDFLPREIINKKKHGFGLPFGVWMRDHEPLQSMVGVCFESLAQRRIFAADFLQLALQKQRSDTPGYYGELVWVMMMLELWLAANESQADAGR